MDSIRWIYEWVTLQVIIVLVTAFYAFFIFKPIKEEEEKKEHEIARRIG